jgi:aminopeptidase
MNGKSVEIDNTDAEGRLILSGMVFLFFCLLLAYWYEIDALYYTSTTYKPHTLIDVATLTGFGYTRSQRYSLHLPFPP